MNYKTYAEAKIANPDSEIFTNDKEFKAVKDAPTSHFFGGWTICNPAKYCSSIKEFLVAGFKFAIGDLFLGTDGAVHNIGEMHPQTNKCEDSDGKRYILSASSLNGGCKLPSKEEQWTIYNNTLPLCELTDEQAAPIVDAWRTASNQLECFDVNEWFMLGSEHHIIKRGIYRIKSKSERELFIDEAINHAINPETQSVKQIFGELFDSGKFKYIDNTQHFGENI